MPSGYSSREDPGQMKKNKQSMADLKLRRLTELNSRLREDLERERIPVSQASKRYSIFSSSFPHTAAILILIHFLFAAFVPSASLWHTATSIEEGASG
jgi:GGL domain